MLNFNYYYPKSFLFQNNKYLFFDIFIKNNELVLIIPIYEDFILDDKKIIITFNNNKLKLIDTIKYIEYEGIIILKYLIDYELDDKNIFTVKYENKVKKFELEIDIFNNIFNNIINNNLSISTLFKDDLYLLDTWISFYSKKNISDFYLYYNDKIDKNISIFNKIKEKYKDLNITIIEWNFHYWNNSNKYKHHAQTGMLNHCLYYFNKNYHTYWLNIDLDEYINNIDNISLLEKKDFYLYHNRWAKLEDNINFRNYIDLYQTKFYLGEIQSLIKKENNNDFDFLTKKYKSKIYLLINRTKWIINTNNFNAVGIHLPKLNFNIFNKEYKIDNNHWFAHFSNWSNSKIRNHSFSDNYIYDYHYN